jgi:hypothetical protein
MPEEKRPDVRPQLREFLAWYEDTALRRGQGNDIALPHAPPQKNVET